MCILETGERLSKYEVLFCDGITQNVMLYPCAQALCDIALNSLQ